MEEFRISSVSSVSRFSMEFLRDTEVDTEVVNKNNIIKEVMSKNNNTRRSKEFFK